MLAVLLYMGVRCTDDLSDLVWYVVELFLCHIGEELLV
jgi:hypothetical protein